MAECGPVSATGGDASGDSPKAEELQSLLDRIQSEGVAKAETRAAEIVAEAEKKAASIVAERDKEPFFSVEDVQIRAGLNKNVMEVLRASRVFDGICETDQLSMF